MTYLTAIFIVLITAFLVAGCVFLVRKYVHISFLQKHHEVAFTIFLQEGVIYGVLLAFVVSIVWTQFNQVAEEMQQEVTSLLVIAKISTAFPEPISKQVSSDIENYMNAVLHREWQTMSHGQMDPLTQKYFDQLTAIFLQYQPQNTREEGIYEEVLRNISGAGEIRRLRIFHSAVSVPDMIWVILIFFGILVIALPLFFGMEHQWSQALITAGLTAMIVAILTLIYLLDNPFGPDLHVNKGIFNEGLQQLIQLR